MALDNKITVKFIPDGDKRLIKAIEKLDSVHRKLTDAQQNLVEGGKRAHRLNNQHIIAYKRYTDAVKKQNKETEKEIKSQQKRNKQISTLRRSLKELGADFRKAGISSKTHTDAIRGSRIALAKMDIQTKKYIARMKQQEAGIFGLIGSNRLLGGSFAVLRSKLLLVSFAGTLVASTIGRLARQFGVQQDAEKDLSTQLGHTNKELLRQASAIQSITTHGDESLLMIMRFASTLGIQEKNLVKVTKASIGLSEAYGLDLRQSTRMLALATSGNTEMLNRYITELRNTTDESEKLAIISQKVTDGYRLHIARAGTLNFALDQMGNSVGDVAEKIGKILSPVVIFSSIKLREFADSFDDAKANRYVFVLGSMGIVFGVLRAKAIYATIAMNGFTASLTRTGIGALVVVGGVLIEKLLEMGGAFEHVTEDIEDFNDAQSTSNKLTKAQAENIEKIIKLEKDRVKTIDEELASLVAKEAQLLGADSMEQMHIQHGIEFVQQYKKKIEKLIEMRKRVEELEDAERTKEIDERERLKNNQKRNKKIERQQKEHERFLEQQKREHQQKMKELDDERIKARDEIFANDMAFQMKKVEMEAERYRQLLTSAEERVAIDEFENNRKLELAQKHLEENNLLYNASFSAYDTFVQTMINSDMDRFEKQKAVMDSFKKSIFAFLADMIKAKIKQAIAEQVITKTAQKKAVSDAELTGMSLANAYRNPAIYASTASFGLAGVLGLGALISGIATLKGIDKFEKGGLVGGKRHSQGGTVIEAEQGEFVMSRNAVDSIGIDNLQNMNQGGGAGITINISAPLVDETIVDTIIPAIEKAQRMNLA